MKKSALIVLTIAMLAGTLSMLSGCRSKSEDEGIFVPASEEYMILDEGENSNPSADGKKDSSSNTNAKKASDSKDSKSGTASDAQQSSAPKATSSPAGSGKGSNGGSSSGSENEMPFVPAEGSGSDSAKSAAEMSEEIAAAIDK